MVADTGVRGCDNTGKEGTTRVPPVDYMSEQYINQFFDTSEVAISTLANTVHAVALSASSGSALTDH